MQLILKQLFTFAVKLSNTKVIVKEILEKSLLPSLGRTMKMIDYFIHDQLKESGRELSKEQWLLLKILNDVDGRPQNDLAFITNRDKGSLARLLNTMENRNLVVRIPSKTDRRVNEIYLTKHGKLELDKTAPLFEKVIKDIEMGITKKEIDAVISVMKKISLNIKSKELVAVETKKQS